MRATEAFAGVAIGLAGSALFEWAVKPPVERIAPAIGSIVVSLGDFSDSVVENSANYSENFSGLLLLSGSFVFIFKAIAAAVSALDFGGNRVRQLAITRCCNLGGEVFVILLSLVSLYAGLLVHERVNWFQANMTRLDAVASLGQSAPFQYAEVNALRAEWTEMRTPSDLKVIVSKVQALGKQANVPISPVTWSE